MFTEFTVLLFAILEPLHQAGKHKASTSISALINIEIKLLLDKQIVYYSHAFARKGEELLPTITICYNKIGDTKST